MFGFIKRDWDICLRLILMMGVLVKKPVFTKHLFYVGKHFSTFFTRDILYYAICSALEEPDVQWALENNRFLAKKTFDFDIG